MKYEKKTFQKLEVQIWFVPGPVGDFARQLAAVRGLAMSLQPALGRTLRAQLQCCGPLVVSKQPTTMGHFWVGECIFLEGPIWPSFPNRSWTSLRNGLILPV